MEHINAVLAIFCIGLLFINTCVAKRRCSNEDHGKKDSGWDERSSEGICEKNNNDRNPFTVIRLKQNDAHDKHASHPHDFARPSRKLLRKRLPREVPPEGQKDDSDKNGKSSVDKEHTVVGSKDSSLLLNSNQTKKPLEKLLKWDTLKDKLSDNAEDDLVKSNSDSQAHVRTNHHATRLSKRESSSKKEVSDQAEGKQDKRQENDDNDHKKGKRETVTKDNSDEGDDQDYHSGEVKEYSSDSDELSSSKDEDHTLINISTGDTTTNVSQGNSSNTDKGPKDRRSDDSSPVASMFPLKGNPSQINNNKQECIKKNNGFSIELQTNGGHEQLLVFSRKNANHETELAISVSKKANGDDKKGQESKSYPEETGNGSKDSKKFNEISGASVTFSLKEHSSSGRKPVEQSGKERNGDDDDEGNNDNKRDKADGDDNAGAFLEKNKSKSWKIDFFEENHNDKKEGNKNEGRLLVSKSEGLENERHETDETGGSSNNATQYFALRERSSFSPTKFDWPENKSRGYRPIIVTMKDSSMRDDGDRDNAKEYYNDKEFSEVGHKKSSEEDDDGQGLMDSFETPGHRKNFVNYGLYRGHDDDDAYDDHFDDVDGDFDPRASKRRRKSPWIHILNSHNTQILRKLNAYVADYLPSFLKDHNLDPWVFEINKCEITSRAFQEIARICKCYDKHFKATVALVGLGQFLNPSNRKIT